MAMALLSQSSPPCTTTTTTRGGSSSIGASRPAPFLLASKDFFCLAPPRLRLLPRHRIAPHHALPTRSSSASPPHIPKQFREDRLKEGLMENFRNVPSYFYGLTPSQIDMFLTEDSAIKRQAEQIPEESISSAKNYRDGTGMWNLTSLSSGSSRLSMSVNMYRGIGGYGRPKTSPPDLPSLLLDARICYLGMPIVPAVTELIVAELLWLDYDNPNKPIYFYINSPGTQKLFLHKKNNVLVDISEEYEEEFSPNYMVEEWQALNSAEIQHVNVDIENHSIGHSEKGWCALCGAGNGWMMCNRCMGEGGFATRPGLAGVQGKVGWARCKTCFGRKIVPCLVCGLPNAEAWRRWLDFARCHPIRDLTC